MLLTTIRTAPALSDFTPLQEHQEQTPASFFDGKPVLHYFTTGAKAWIPKSQLGKLIFFPEGLSSDPTGPEGIALNGTVVENVEQKVDLYVSSQTLTIFCPATSSGLSIPYPQISIHAIKTIGSSNAAYQSVYLQLELSEPDGEEDLDTVELTLIPQSNPTTADASEAAVPEAKKLYQAISDCSDLNPDPVDQDDEDMEDAAERIVFEGDYQPVEGYEGVYASNTGGDLPPPMPGSGGWITAENMHEFFDADGNWIGGGNVTVIGDDEEGVSGELGDGAGVVHGRDEEDTGESKRARVE